MQKALDISAHKLNMEAIDNMHMVNIGNGGGLPHPVNSSLHNSQRGGEPHG